ncbi:uncharacterized protein LOC115396065 [Salarias fasciatus]|uniref:uncharacterized protein LOC115396065 n=1 Tax=Salarias fasciatus TaxID=181472 RepID=UPI001176F86B|nr:uncharacterized protein LOC115396065 [Salarias fasciatus]
MELHCLLTETPTTSSSSSTDPLYDNCPPFGQRERARGKEMESRVVCPVVTRLPGPSSPPPGLIPAVAEVQAVVIGQRGLGTWPDHSYCSCRGGPAWEAEPSPGMNRARGRGGQGCHWGDEDRAHQNRNPSPSRSEEHQSALSLYDNLPDSETAESLQEVSDMETSFQEQMYRAWVPEPIQGGREGDAETRERSPWSSCETGFAKSHSNIQDQNPDQDRKHELAPELDSRSCRFMPVEPTAHYQLPKPRRLTASSPQLCQAPEPPAQVQHPMQPASWTPRVPPPVPLADPSASALRSLLTSLQQQIVRQREEYEERILSLEQRNEELQVEVVRLKTNLAQQRHWYQVVQTKIAESERARAAAELRNATLQSEMEQFFDTFGELNSEAKKTECIVKSF